MLPISFFGQNLNFATHLFFSLVAFATFWLYFDAWLVSKKKEEISKWLGFVLLALSFLTESVLIDSDLVTSNFWTNSADTLLTVARLLGYFLIILALLREPLQKRPKEATIDSSNYFFLPSGLLKIGSLFFAPLAFLVSLLYIRKATVGMERHLRRVAGAFAALGVFEVLSYAKYLRGTSSVDLYNLVAPYGLVWFSQQFFLFLATLLLGFWVWSYLTKRIQSQLFIIFTSSVLLISFLISSSLSFLLFKNIENSSLTSLNTATKVLAYNLETKKNELTRVAEVYAKNKEVADAVLANNHEKLVGLLEGALADKKVSSIIITAKSSLVLARAEDSSEWGDSLSSDKFVTRVLSGQDGVNVLSKDSSSAKVLTLQSASPILQNGSVVGSVLVSLEISNNFLDGVKKSTGLETSVYAGNVRSATTLLSPDKKSRFIGNKEQNSEVKEKVLEKGENFLGNLEITNQPFLAAYQPIRDNNNEVVGMLFAGQIETEILKSAAGSIQQVYLLSILLLLLSIIPSYLIAKSITRQLH